MNARDSRRCLRNLFLDLLDERLKLLMAFADEVGPRAFAHRAVEKVAKQCAGALVRRQLIVLKVHGGGLDAGAI